MDYAANNAKQLRDIVLRLERLQADVTRLSGQKLPDRFVLFIVDAHCGGDCRGRSSKSDCCDKRSNKPVGTGLADLWVLRS